MSQNEPSRSGDRYDALEIASDEVVIYDVDNHRAWLQSDGAVDRDEIV